MSPQGPSDASFGALSGVSQLETSKWLAQVRGHIKRTSIGQSSRTLGNWPHWCCQPHPLVFKPGPVTFLCF